MNLMPESTLRWQALNQKKPYLVATVFSLVLVALAIGFLFQELAASKQAEIDRITPEVDNETHKSDVFNAANTKLQQSHKQADQIVALLQERYYWGDFLAEMRSALIRAEAGVQKKLSAQKPGVQAGIWVEKMTAATDLGANAAPPGVPQWTPENRGPYRGQEGGVPIRNDMGNPGGYPASNPMGNPAASQTDSTTNVITLLCRAVSLTSVDPSANPEIAYAVGDEIKNSPVVDPKTTQVVGQISPDDANGTFTFTVSVTPLKTLDY
jgi:hypothetical protein